MSYLDILLLAILSGEPAHGYEIRQKVERILSGAVSMNPNVLYPALHRFEAMGRWIRRWSRSRAVRLGTSTG